MRSVEHEILVFSSPLKLAAKISKLAIVHRCHPLNPTVHLHWSHPSTRMLIVSDWPGQGSCYIPISEGFRASLTRNFGSRITMDLSESSWDLCCNLRPFLPNHFPSLSPFTDSILAWSLNALLIYSYFLIFILQRHFL